MKATSRIILTQKQCITTTSKLNYKIISTSNQHEILNNNLFNKSLLFPFSTTAKDDDDDDDTDSDLSDFSDFSDSDDSDLEDNITKTSDNKKKQWQFSNDQVPSESLETDKLIISNLNFSTNRNDIWELCENYGSVVDVHLPSNKNREFHNRGFGFVTFESQKAAQNALDNVAGITFNSRQIRAGFARKDTERKPSFDQSGPRGYDRKERSEFEFTSNRNVGSNVSSMSDNNKEFESVEIVDGIKELTETTVTVNGLPGNVNLSQITKMFGGFGNITNITFSPYRMFGYSFMNAIVSINLKIINNIKDNENNKDFSFQKESDIKDRSIDKNEMKTMRKHNIGNSMHNNPQKKNENKNVNGIDPDILAKEIDELLADTDDDDDDDDDDEDDDDDNNDNDDGDDNDNDESDSDSDSDSDSSSSDDDEEDEEEQDTESSDDDDDDRIK